VFEIDTGKEHKFEKKILKAKFRVELQAVDGKPLADKKYKLSLDNHKPVEGTTDSSAVIECDISPQPTRGTLTVWVESDPEKTVEWSLNLGSLDPIDTLTGVQARLTNLGFKCGSINGKLDEKTREAITQFQIVYALTVTGEPDKATREKLVAVHDKQ
jgi:putative peptidoglycan binding protein